MSSIEGWRPTLSGLGAAATLAGGFLFTATKDAEAQDTPPTVRLGEEPLQLPPIQVESTPMRPSNVLQDSTGIGRLPDRLQSTPQTITLVPREVIEQQQATTVDQVLRYVPGVTVSTGEGNGGISGDQFRIRGFDASGDIYVDGLRDFGSYVRDSFATESVAVLKGPSSGSFGNGTTGGVIALTSKRAHLGNDSSFEVLGGLGPYGRSVLDVNRQVGERTAVRLVVMGQGQDVVGRDHVYANRWGTLGSVAFGLGTDQQVTLNYFHQQSTQRPDFGVPIVNTRGVVGRPVTEYGVPRSTYFGRDSDRDAATADVATLLYKGQFGDWLTLTNDTRFGVYARDLKFTPVFCSTPGRTGPSACATDVLAGRLNTPYTIWTLGGTRAQSHGGENVTTAVMRFNTGPFRHELVAGIDGYAQHASTGFYVPSGPEPAGTLLRPVFANSAGFALVPYPRADIAATSWDVGPFLSERVWMLPTLSVLGGVRWDHYHVGGTAAGTPVETTTEFASPRGALIWEPTPAQTYYASYAQSFTPAANNITSLSSSLGLSQSGTRADLKPERDETFEIGAKWSILDTRLGATAALFRVNKSNASYTDPTSGIATTTDDKVRVQGVELGLTGKITPNWDVQASYSFLDSRIQASTISVFSPAPAAGNKVPYVSQHNVGIWSTYDVAPLIRGLPGQLLVGGGVNYRSGYYVNNLNTLRVPGATTVDALLSYSPRDRYRLALNVQNLTDALAYGSAFSNGYAVPVAGRTVTLTAGIRF